MLEYIPGSGFWVPKEKIGRAMMYREPSKDGLPTHGLETIEIAMKLCKQRRVAIDGGAYIGSWSIHLIRTFERVLAFEPIVSNFQYLQRNLQDKAELYCCALTDESGELGVRPEQAKSYSHQVFKGESKDRVSGLRLDDLKLDNVDLLKLDVEGHEFEALQGANETLLRCRPVIVIEEKFDPARRATAYLTGLGMSGEKAHKHDVIFTWPN